jgi:hypothetical protein
MSSVWSQYDMVKVLWLLEQAGEASILQTFKLCSDAVIPKKDSPSVCNTPSSEAQLRSISSSTRAWPKRRANKSTGYNCNDSRGATGVKTVGRGGGWRGALLWTDGGKEPGP